MQYSWTQYREDLKFALLIALGFTLIAALPLAIGGLVNVVALLRDRPPGIPWLAYGAMWFVIPGSYVAAALTGGTAAFLLRPIRHWLLGWMITGGLVAACIYGSVGVALAVFYNPVGAVILERSTREEAWQLILPMLGFLSPVGGVVGLYMGWRDRQGRPIW